MAFNTTVDEISYHYKIPNLAYRTGSLCSIHLFMAWQRNRDAGVELLRLLDMHRVHNIEAENTSNRDTSDAYDWIRDKALPVVCVLSAFVITWPNAEVNLLSHHQLTLPMVQKISNYECSGANSTCIQTLVDTETQ